MGGLFGEMECSSIGRLFQDGMHELQCVTPLLGWHAAQRVAGLLTMACSFSVYVVNFSSEWA